MGGRLRIRVQAQPECGSNQKQIHAYPVEDKKKRFSPQTLVLSTSEICPQIQVKKGFRRNLVLTSLWISDLLELPATFLSKCPGSFLSV